METEFSKLFGYIRKLRIRYMNTLSAYKIYDCFNTLVATNIVGKERSNKNVATFNSFKYFFQPVREACRCYFLIELAKFFDKSTQSLTVFNILDYSEKNIKKLTKKDFLDYHKGRKILPELFKNYKPLLLSDIRRLRKKIDSNKVILKKLKDYRDKYLAHDDIKKIKVKLTKKEIEEIFDLIEKFIDLYYLKLDFASNSYINFEEKPIKETERIIEYLQSYEEYRIKEI
ncbi:MAG: AbiU2 domain-containing protein, partial [Promethearchaeota archaeon]